MAVRAIETPNMRSDTVTHLCSVIGGGQGPKLEWLPRTVPLLALTCCVWRNVEGRRNAVLRR